MMGKGSKDVSQRVITSFGVIVLVSLTMSVAGITLIASRADQMSREREVRLVTNSVESRVYGLIARQRNMIMSTTPDQIALSTPRERLFLVAADGTVTPLRQSPGLKSWSVAGIRSALAPAFAMLKDPARNMIEGVPGGVNLVWIEGHPLLVVAAPARGNSDQVVIDVVDVADIEPELQRRFALPNMAFVPAGHDSEAETIRIADPRGKVIMPTSLALHWDKAMIGQTILSKAAPIFLAVALMFLGAGAWLALRMRSMARSLVASETHAKHLALHDPMTGLANRALFNDRLDHAIEMRRRMGGDIAVVVIDLDRFKKVNDTLGHQAGDALIREASRRITTVCRASDTVARLGGDEFALVLSPIDGLAGAEILCGRLSRALSTVLELPAGQAVLSASLGVCVISDDQTGGVDAVRQADLALYRAKAEGRGRYKIFEAEMDESQKLRRMVETDLREALDNGRLEVAYQPQYTAKGKIEGVEALVRWNHPDRGPIAPDEFIPVAEEAGLIDDLGEFVMRTALCDAAGWPGIKVAINVSPIQLRRETFVERCATLAKAAGVDPRRIELEITEGVLLENDAQVQETLKGLRDLGFRLALDDFGTGYSSLSYLNLYPIDKIKIDRSFVNNLSLDGESDKVVSAIIHLGRVLGLSVTAEGVETELQRAKLVAAGCNSLQGYLHGRPTTAAAIDSLMGKLGEARTA